MSLTEAPVASLAARVRLRSGEGSSGEYGSEQSREPLRSVRRLGEVHDANDATHALSSSIRVYVCICLQPGWVYEVRQTVV